MSVQDGDEGPGKIVVLDTNLISILKRWFNPQNKTLIHPHVIPNTYIVCKTQKEKLKYGPKSTIKMTHVICMLVF